MIDPIAEKYADLDAMQDALQRATREAIAEHHRQGRAVPVWKDGQLAWFCPDGSFTTTSPYEGKPDESVRTPPPTARDRAHDSR